MILRRPILSLLALSLLAPAAVQASCVAPADARAMQLRQLHVQLQVASLNCRGDDATLATKYGAYINRFSVPLADNAKDLKAHFARSGKGDAQRNLDRYMTRLANDESQRAHEVADYCEAHVPLFDKLAELKPGELEHFASTQVPAPAICKDAKAEQASAPAADKPKKKEKKS